MKARGIRVVAWRRSPSNNAWTTKGINGSAPFNHLGRVNEMLGGLIISKATYARLLTLMRSLRNALLEGTRMIRLRRFSEISRFMCSGASVFTRATTDLNYLWIQRAASQICVNEEHGFKGIVHHKNEDSVIIYSPSCSLKTHMAWCNIRYIFNNVLVVLFHALTKNEQKRHKTIMKNGWKCHKNSIK